VAGRWPAVQADRDSPSSHGRRGEAHGQHANARPASLWRRSWPVSGGNRNSEAISRLSIAARKHRPRKPIWRKTGGGGFGVARRRTGRCGTGRCDRSRSVGRMGARWMIAPGPAPGAVDKGASGNHATWHTGRGCAPSGYRGPHRRHLAPGRGCAPSGHRGPHRRNAVARLRCWRVPLARATNSLLASDLRRR